MSEETGDVARLFARLKDELHATGPRRDEGPRSEARLEARDQAQRFADVSAERLIAGRVGPLKRLLSRALRWYVEPALAEQRTFNGAVLRLLDDLDERVARLEQR